MAFPLIFLARSAGSFFGRSAGSFFGRSGGGGGGGSSMLNMGGGGGSDKQPIPRITITSNIGAVLAQFKREVRQMKPALAKALTFTAERVRDAERREIGRVFDRPTSFTLNSLYLKGATPNSLEARVWYKDLRFKQHYLVPQVYGGDRPLKRFEKYLQDTGRMPSGMYAVPGAGAKLDSYGNMGRGQLVQILSALQALPETGYLANKSRRKGARKNKATALIFAGRPHPGWPLGVWQRSGLTGLKPLLIFVSATSYKARFNFYDIAHAVADREFDPIFEREMQRAGSFR